MYVASPTSWKKYEPCRALTVLSIPVFAYSANAIVDMDEEGRIGREIDVFQRDATADHFVIVIMLF